MLGDCLRILDCEGQLRDDITDVQNVSMPITAIAVYRHRLHCLGVASGKQPGPPEIFPEIDVVPGNQGIS